MKLNKKTIARIRKARETDQARATIAKVANLPKNFRNLVRQDLAASGQAAAKSS